MLAQARRVAAHIEPLAVHAQRHQRDLRGLPGTFAIGQRDVGEAPRGLQVRVVKQFFGPADGCKRQAVALEDRGQFFGRDAVAGVADLDAERVAFARDATIDAALAGEKRCSTEAVDAPRASYRPYP